MENIYYNQSEDERWNSYFYPGTQTFINKLGITDDSELSKAEREICDQKVEELKKKVAQYQQETREKKEKRVRNLKNT